MFLIFDQDLAPKEANYAALFELHKQVGSAVAIEA
jgi:hypothetical protein